MISYQDYKDENGNINWKAYYQAQRDNGEKCYKCGEFIYPNKGYMSLCYDCQQLERCSGEVDAKSIRCPNCKTIFNPYDEEMYDLLNDGEHDVQCPHCDEEFEISTEVEYSFTSPPLLSEENDEEED